MPCSLNDHDPERVVQLVCYQYAVGAPGLAVAATEAVADATDGWGDVVQTVLSRAVDQAPETRLTQSPPPQQDRDYTHALSVGDATIHQDGSIVDMNVEDDPQTHVFVGKLDGSRTVYPHEQGILPWSESDDTGDGIDTDRAQDSAAAQE
jgi:hypothetical protein